MKYLIVFEAVPETTEFYFLDTEDERTQAQIEEMNGKFAGAVDCPDEIAENIGALESIPGIKKMEDNVLEGLTIILTGLLL